MSSTLDNFFAPAQNVVTGMMQCLHCDRVTSIYHPEGGMMVANGKLWVCDEHIEDEKKWQAEQDAKPLPFAGDTSEWASREGRDGAE